MLANLTVPVLNRYDLLQRMVSSINYPVKHLVIIDNGAGLESLHIPDKIKTVSILPMPSNLGVASSWNLGIKMFNRCPVFFFASADMWFAPGDLEKLAHSSPDEITLHQTAPHWQTFAIGQAAVEKIGLFDEALHPIYFEDNDYMRRAEAERVKIRLLHLTGGHDNSSTIASDDYYKQRNSRSYLSNLRYYEQKVEAGDFTSGTWQIERTRENSWEK